MSGGVPARIVPPPEPWEKQKGESRQAFANFAVYRDLGPRRSVRKAAEACHRSHDTLFEQSAKYNWVERADAYDAFVDSRIREARETEISQAEAQEASLARSLERLVAQRVIGDAENGVPALNAADMDALTTANVLDRAVRIRRLSHGQPTDVLRGHFTITSDQHREVVQGIFDILMSFVPEDVQGRASDEIRLFLETRRAGA